MWWIASELVGQIVDAAQASPDREVCGLLFGTAGAITAIQPCRNVAADPARRFEIDPAALLAAHRAMRGGAGRGGTERGGTGQDGTGQGGAPRVVGHYHSHPGGSAMPSPRDAADAAPDGALWLIVAGGTVRAWRAVERGAVEGRFDAVELRVDPPA